MEYVSLRRVIGQIGRREYLGLAHSTQGVSTIATPVVSLVWRCQRCLMKKKSPPAEEYRKGLLLIPRAEKRTVFPLAWMKKPGIGKARLSWSVWSVKILGVKSFPGTPSYAIIPKRRLWVRNSSTTYDAKNQKKYRKSTSTGTKVTTDVPPILFRGNAVAVVVPFKLMST